MRNIMLVALIPAALSGCGTIPMQRIDTQSTAALKNQTVVYTTREKPNFLAVTVVKSMLGLLGVAAMISDGNSIVANNHIADPADAIANGLAKALHEDYGTQLVSPPIAVNTDDPTEIIADSNDKARFIIDVETLDWGFRFYRHDKLHYAFSYVATARLIDRQTKAVIAAGLCGAGSGNTNPPTYDEMLANHAQFIKKELSTDVTTCVQKFQVQMLPILHG
ncbi:MAG: hypothetical protein V4528_10525 [Pseudomonadota bacterium]